MLVTNAGLLFYVAYFTPMAFVVGPFFGGILNRNNISRDSIKGKIKLVFIQLERRWFDGS